MLKKLILFIILTTQHSFASSDKSSLLKHHGSLMMVTDQSFFKTLPSSRYQFDELLTKDFSEIINAFVTYKVLLMHLEVNILNFENELINLDENAQHLRFDIIASKGIMNLIYALLTPREQVTTGRISWDTNDSFYQTVAIGFVTEILKFALTSTEEVKEIMKFLEKNSKHYDDDFFLKVLKLLNEKYKELKEKGINIDLYYEYKAQHSVEDLLHQLSVTESDINEKELKHISEFETLEIEDDKFLETLSFFGKLPFMIHGGAYGDYNSWYYQNNLDLANDIPSFYSLYDISSGLKFADTSASHLLESRLPQLDLLPKNQFLVEVFYPVYTSDETFIQSKTILIVNEDMLKKIFSKNLPHIKIFMVARSNFSLGFPNLDHSVELRSEDVNASTLSSMRDFLKTNVTTNKFVSLPSTVSDVLKAELKTESKLKVPKTCLMLFK